MHGMKPHKGLKKRVRVSANGKVRHKKSFAGHLMSKKSGTRCQQLRKKVALKGRFEKKAREVLGEA